MNQMDFYGFYAQLRYVQEAQSVPGFRDDDLKVVI